MSCKCKNVTEFDDASPFIKWASFHRDQVFRFVVYRRLFTPYEMEKKFSDESLYEDNHYSYGRIAEVVPLGSGEWLIGFDICDDVDYQSFERIEYYRLSEIRLSLFSYDEKEQDALAGKETIE